MPYQCKHWVPHITVATIVEQDGKFLCVEEARSGKVVINQPAGHVERGESILDAAVRETLEETAYLVEPEHFIALQHWHKPYSHDTYFRILIAAKLIRHVPEQTLDSGIVQAVWLSPDELIRRKLQLRSPVVYTSVENYLNGEKYPLSLLKQFQ